MKTTKNLFRKLFAFGMFCLTTVMFFPAYAGAIAPTEPSISPTTSYINVPTLVTIAYDELNAFSTAYTIDGSDPILSCIDSVCTTGLNTTLYLAPFEINSLEDTDIIIKAISSDEEGALSNIVTNIYTLDTTDPVIDGAADGSTYDLPVKPIISDTNLDLITLNGNPYISGTPINTSGFYTLFATDLAGNFATSTFIIDLDMANPVVEGVEDGEVYYQSIVVTATDTNLDTVTLNDEEFISGSTISSSGEYVLIATDLAGNVTTVNFAISIDTTGPVVDGVADGATYDLPVVATITDINLDSVTLNGELYISGTLIKSDDTYTLVATDLAGHVTTVNFTIALDTAAPVVTGVLEGKIYDLPVIITASDANPDTITLNGEQFTSGTTVTESGEYALIATDLAGNVTIVNFTIVLDTIAPIITGVAEGVIYEAPVVITVSDANIATITLNGAAFVSGSTVSADGTYTLAVSDLGSNAATVHFTILAKKIAAPVEPVVAGAYYAYEAPAETQDVRSEPVLGTIADTKDDSAELVDSEVEDTSDTWVLILIPVVLTFLIVGYWIVAKK